MPSKLHQIPTPHIHLCMHQCRAPTYTLYPSLTAISYDSCVELCLRLCKECPVDLLGSQHIFPLVFVFLEVDGLEEMGTTHHRGYTTLKCFILQVDIAELLLARIIGDVLDIGQQSLQGC